MGYTGTTNYGFQKPEKNNSFNVDDLNNALDKIDETIKTQDIAIESKVNISQGAENAGKVLGINDAGNVELRDFTDQGISKLSSSYSNGNLTIIATNPNGEDVSTKSSIHKKLTSYSIDDVIDVRAPDSTTVDNGYIRIPNEFDIEYFTTGGGNVSRITVSPITLNNLPWATYLRLGVCTTHNSSQAMIYIALLNGIYDLEVRYANSEIPRKSSSTSKTLISSNGYRIYV